MTNLLTTNLHPGFILIFTGLLVLFLPSKWRAFAGLAGSVLSLAAMISLFTEWGIESFAGPAWTYSFTSHFTLELLQIDRLSLIFGLIFCVIAVISAIYGLKGTERGEQGAALIYAGSSLSVVFAGDWITLIFFWEAMAVSSWYLVWAGKTRKAVRASYRYLVMHLFGGNLLLAGAMFICASNGTALTLLTGGSGLGYWLVLIGVCVNGAIPPLHTWVSDAYPESTPAGTVYMGSYTTKVAIYALVRFFAGTEELVLWGAVMAVFGACMALIENDLRRLLSYHIVSQLGMMVAALGTGSTVGIDGASLHAAFNILYKGVLLMGAGAVITATGKRKITELGGLGRKMPVTAVCFLIASLSIAGMPFLNGFASKALIMESLHDYTVAYWLVTLAGVGTWLSITMKINYFVFWGKKGTGQAELCQKVPVSMEIAMILGAAICVVTGVLPELFYAMTPGQTMGHPFTAEHILEYIGLFIGATVPFMLLLKKMAPHDMISLDFDWLYRKGLAPALTGLSVGVTAIFGRFDKVWNHFLAIIRYMIKNPNRKLFSNLSQLAVDENQKDDEGVFEGDVPVGAFMQIFIVFCVIAFIVIMILE